MKFYFVMAFSLVALFSYSQTENTLDPCATPFDLESEKFLTKFFDGELNYKIVDDTIWVPMTSHLVYPEEGKPNFGEVDILRALCHLNENFSEVGIQFYHSSFEYIFNDDYYDHGFSDGIQMMNENNIFGTANSYFVLSPAGNCGYFAPSGGAVAMAFSCSGAFDDTWAHEMGHYFSLPHTFRGWEGEDYVNNGQKAPNFINNRKVELAEDDPDCLVSGDRFCDTPADYLSFRWTCNNNGLSSVLQLDPDSTAFRSDGSYFMSYANSSCMNRFSPLQMEAMVANLQNTKSSQIDEDYEWVDVNTNETIMVSPVQDEVVESSTTTLTWNETGNAKHYLVEVSRFPGFNFLNAREYTDILSVDISNLQPDKTYYWRITPFGDSDFCTEKTEVKSFTTAFLPVAVEASEADNFKLFPNPSNGALTIDWSSSDNFDVLFMNIYGQRVSSRLQVANGSRIVHDLPSGIYLIEVTNKEKRTTKKIIVQ